ncbi:MAG: flavin oxidoreductase/NADH oxidase [Christensenellales bacterium]
MDRTYDVLTRPVAGRGFTLKNALAIQPMEGCDAEAGGAPGDWTLRRYQRFADGGAGLIWAEAIGVSEDARGNPRQLMLTEDNVGAFTALTDAARARGAVIIAQLTHSGRFSHPAPIRACAHPALDARQKLGEDYPIVADDALARLPEQFARAARLAMRAGFHGVDVKACHLYLYSELLGAVDRPGRYGGSYENRVRLLKDTVQAVKPELDGGILASRLNLYDGEAGNWGVGEGLAPDYTEPLRLVGELSEMGVSLMNITMGTPYLNPHVNRPYSSGGYAPPEPPEVGVSRLLEGCRAAQAAAGDAVCVATGFSHLRHRAPKVAATLIESGGARAAGFGRMAFAYPDFARDILENGGMDAKKCCVTCSLCTKIMRAGGRVGCPVRDRDLYLPELRRVTT